MSARKGVYQRRGKSFRWFVAVDVDGQPHYQERLTALDGTPLHDSRCMTWGATEALEGQGFGEGQEVRTSLSFIPSQAVMKRGDLVLITEPQVALSAAKEFRRSGATHTLPHWPCLLIEDIWVDGVPLSKAAYTATESGLTWNTGAPAEGALFYVRWRYLPLWQWDGAERTHLQLGDTEALPQRGQAHLVRDFKPSLILP